MRILGLLLILATFLTVTTANAQSGKPLHLYLLMGQSNMAGRGAVTEEYAGQKHERVLMLNKDNEWVQAQHPVHFDKPKVVGVGPGLAFGIAMAEADTSIVIGLIPCAVGGSSIQHWMPGAFDPATKTHPYDDAVVRIKAAAKPGVFKGIIWHQGESDMAPEKAIHYADDLTTVITNIRRETGNVRLPIVMGELAPFLEKAPNINVRLTEVAKRVPCAAVASSAGLTDKGDVLHFDSRSATILGERYAKEMLHLSKK